MADVENQTTVDLFGNVRFLHPRKRGRPPFEWTRENSHKVSMLLAAGWSNERIAGCVLDPRTGKSISVPTLQRYFRCELAVRDSARDQLTAKRLMQASEAADAGNVGAMRLMDQLLEKNDQKLADAKLGDRSKAQPTERPGKKEMSADAAKQAEDNLRQEAERARKH